MRQTRLIPALCAVALIGAPVQAANNDEWHLFFGVITPLAADPLIKKYVPAAGPIGTVAIKLGTCAVVGYGLEEFQGRTGMGVNDKRDGDLVMVSCALTIAARAALRAVFGKRR